MDLEERERLAHLGDVGQPASAIRLLAALKVTGLQHQELASAAGVGKTAISNMLAGSSYPNRAVLKYLYRAHRIDFNFMIHGDFAQLPRDVQGRLFPALEAANTEWDQRQGSDRSRASATRGQA